MNLNKKLNFSNVIQNNKQETVILKKEQYCTMTIIVINTLTVYFAFTFFWNYFKYNTVYQFTTPELERPLYTIIS